MRKLSNIPFTIFIKVLFSNKFIFTGLFLALISGMLLASFLPNMDIHSEKYKTKEVQTCKGVITNITETNNSVNDHKIYKYSFNYKLSGKSIQGHSFSKQLDTNISDTVEIEYLSNNQNISRIRGTRNAPFEISEILTMLLVIFSLGLFIILLIAYKKLVFIRILKTGFDVVETKFVSEINFSLLPGNGTNTYKLKFNYSIGNRDYTKSVFTQISDFKLRRVRKSNILVDSKNPGKSYLIELMPQKLITHIEEKSTFANDDK